MYFGSQNEIISADQFAKGFSRVYEIMQDLSLDIPNALPLTNALKSRALTDKVLRQEPVG